MREILFKAKRLDNGQWVEGNYGFFKSVNGNEKMHHITTESGKAIRVDPTTLCQFTGMTDKKRKKVWENDIVKVHIFHEIAEGYGNHVNEQGVLCYDSIGILSLRTSMYENIPCYSDILMQAELAGVEIDVEVIGNVFDNPELLEERAQYESV